MKFAFETERLRFELYNRKLIRYAHEFYLRNADLLREFEPAREPAFYTLRSHRRQYRHDRRDMMSMRYLSFPFFLKDNPRRIIGFVNVNDISFGVSFSCTVGYKTDIMERNKGYMKEALGKVIEVLFEELGLHRIEADVMPGNGPSLAVLKSLGFVEEGFSRDYLKINGKWKDHIRLARVNDKGERPDV